MVLHQPTTSTLTMLSCAHEEADNRLVLHGLEEAFCAGFLNIIAYCRDTDILLLLAFFGGQECHVYSAKCMPGVGHMRLSN